MQYISLASSKEEAMPERFRQAGWLYKNIVYFIRCKLGIILETGIDDKNLIILPNLNKNILKKIRKIIKVKCIKNICVSENLKKEIFLNELQELDVNILNGRWMYKYLLYNIVEHIIKNKKDELKRNEISLLINNIEEIDAYNIVKIAKETKVINIVTKREDIFRNLSEKLKKEEGIILNIVNNKKSILRSDIIINFDFDEKLIKKYTFPKKACIINLKKQIGIDSGGFDGINISSYKIKFPKKYIKYKKTFEKFDETVLYESFIYKKTSVKNIINEIKNDEVEIECLENDKGKIKQEEYVKTEKKEIKV